MKNIYLLGCLFLFYTGYTQNNERKRKVDTISLGESFGRGEKIYTFKKVIEDSRCPTDATCIWQGQAKVLIEIDDCGEVSHEEVLITNASSFHNNMQYYNLIPMPRSTTDFKDRNYRLVLGIKGNRY